MQSRRKNPFLSPLASLSVAAVLLLAAVSCAKLKAPYPSEIPSAVMGGVGAAPLQERASVADTGVEMNTEEYGRITDNPFLETLGNPLSTFSIDVDRASYSNVRRFLTSNQRPPHDAVRIEEMINYFSYDYPDPPAEQPFSITTEIASCPWNEKNRLLLIGLQGRRIDTADLPPGNLVFLLDVSGSMLDANKLPLVKSAMGLLVDQLRPQDRVAIVAYAGSAGLVLPSTPGSEKGRILDAIERLAAGGSTAGGEGIVLAYKIAQEHFVEGGNNRVVLATDGDFNVGVSSDGELERLIEEKRRAGVFLTVLGFGTGNVKDSKMELLADKGNGNYAYVDTIHEAKKVLVQELGATLTTIAKDVKLQIEFNPAKVRAYRLIGYENRLLRAEDFHDDAKDAGEMGAGHSVTALYELVPPDGDLAIAKVDPLKYQTTTVLEEASASPELLTLKLRYKEPDAEESRLLTQAVLDSTIPVAAASENLRFAAAVAELGLLLRESPYKSGATYDQVAAMAGKALGDDREGYRAEFLRLVDAASRVAQED
ncbi:MAG TPA: VWA domain-containing protein [Thermoanaerobaculia bacterium]|nr:VWA domain-containing protein [Thermoanaerobaculia bacterium]